MQRTRLSTRDEYLSDRRDTVVCVLGSFWRPRGETTSGNRLQVHQNRACTKGRMKYEPMIQRGQLQS